MAVNLWDVAKLALGSGALGKIAGSLGESEAKTTSAMDLAGPAILGSLIKKVSSPQGTKTSSKRLNNSIPVYSIALVICCLAVPRASSLPTGLRWGQA